MLYLLANAANVEGWRLDLVQYIFISFSCFYSASITFKNLKN